jgi:GMP synthase (glutamine-hydrolysing)
MTRNIHEKKILILDFGSQYTQLIARRVRDLGVYSELHPYTLSEEKIRALAPAGIILSGGPDSVTVSNTARAPEIVFQLGCPVLGICYGMQTMAEQLGGKVATSAMREFGYAKVTLTEPSRLFENIADLVTEDGVSTLDVWMSHGDHVETLPPEFVTIATTDAAITAMADETRQFYGLQFHPEVSHTLQGLPLLKKFLFDICGCQPVWTTDNIIDEMMEKVRSDIGTDQVILGLSGGVDSSVVAALLHKAIGNQLTCVFVDTGLLRLHEAAEVQDLFAKHMGLRLITIDAGDRFFAALAGVTDPEDKRKVIGGLFIKIFEEEAGKVKDAKWLAQGTIYPDVIESAATAMGTSHVIKSHHNVGGLPEKMHLKLVEPLRELFKDEVIKLGMQLGLPTELLHRHPFPGPGLGVRILGEVKKEYAEKLRRADYVLIEELCKQDLYHKVNQAFAVFLPVKSVGVLGDARHYDHVICLRAVETVDFMTAHWARLPYDFLDTVSSRIINEVPGISRVTYDISSKPPATIEWE